MTKNEKGRICILIEQESDVSLIKEVIKYGYDLSRALSLELEVILMFDGSLAHYGRVDPLASFESKRQFVEYIEENAKDELKKLLKIINQFSFNKDRAFYVNVVEKEQFYTHIAKMANIIEFIIALPKIKKGILKEKITIPGLKIFRKLKINVLLFNKLAY